MREIAAGVGLRSSGTVLYHLKKLEEDGSITMTGAQSRSVHLTQTKQGVPLVGQVAAGVPILAEENIEGYVPLTDERYENCFALRVKGSSMIGAGILSGDQVIVRRQNTARNGDIVVAMIDGEATVKYWRQMMERGEMKIWLMPDNHAFSPIDGTNAQILGKVISVLREY